MAQDDTDAEAEPTAPTSGDSILPELDSYTFTRAGLWWAVLARDH
jgi:hypothetical protein